ncbi:MAG TPA: hypothetical protein DEO82_01170 [Eubacterium sp.]|nr:hypothetical protein [Eubacterium sp.]
MNKQIEDLIKNTNPKVPTELQPDHIRLTKKHRKINPMYAALPVAACITLLVGILAFNNRGIGTKKTYKSEPTKQSQGITNSDNTLKKDGNAYSLAFKAFQTYRTRTVYYTSGSVYTEGDLVSNSITSVKKGAEVRDGSPSSTAGDYSQTNTRHENIDEGSMVKTDGTYIYALDHIADNQKPGSRAAMQVTIYKANGSSPAKISSIEVSSYTRDMYLHGDKLVIISCIPQNDDPSAVRRTGYETYATFYDLTNIENPKANATIHLEGSYNTSRLTGDTLYLITDVYKYSYGIEYDETDYSTYIPTVNGQVVPEGCIDIAPGTRTPDFTTIISVDTKKEEIVDTKSILGSGDIYMSDSAIYHLAGYYKRTLFTVIDEALGTELDDSSNQLSIIKIPYDSNGNFEEELIQSVNGSINDDYSIDEYKDYLRLVTTCYTNQGTSAALYILNSNLDITGSIEDIAKGETVRSVRFLGDIGYFVTFRNTDPLFSVDLKDPTNPKIIGELKIPGFSAYLHPIDENHLLGIGLEYQEIGERLNFKGIKVSIYDISDPTDVKETKKTVFDKLYSASPINDPNNFFYDSKSGLIGFGVSGYTSSSVSVNQGNCYMVCDITGDTIKAVYQSKPSDTYKYSSTYGLYIGNYIYILPLDGTIEAVKMP